ncbi:MAG: hypothetical protein HQM03_10725 [Magnetococcales bacterium]|nr:hypothetical protein [Magnetococcales bacterium]
MSDPGATTCWHCLVGATLNALLEPVGIEVRTEVPLLSLPPKAGLKLWMQPDRCAHPRHFTIS